MPLWRKVVIGLAVVAVVLGVIGLATAISWWLAVVALVVAALTARKDFDEFIGRVVGAVIVATIALVGFNVATFAVTWPAGKALDWIFAIIMLAVGAFAGHREPKWPPILRLCFLVLGLGFLTGVLPATAGIVVGLIVAVLLFGLVVYWRLSLANWGAGRTAFVAAVVALVVILLPPILFGDHESTRKPVATSQRLASELDVLIVTDGRHHPVSQNPLPDPARGFDVRYSVGYARGERVQWTLADEPSADRALGIAAQGDRAPARAAAPTRRGGADAVLVLLVDGTDPVTQDPAQLPNRPGGGAAEVDRWRKVAVDAGAGGDLPIPVFPLLESTGKTRLAQWNRFMTSWHAVSLQELGSKTVTDAAVRLSVGAPTSQQDFNLAMEHRPLLLFDRTEKVPRPLSVASLFSQDRVKLCDDRRVVTDCGSPIRDARELRNGGTHLQISPPSDHTLQTLARTDQRVIGKATAATTVKPSVPGAPPAATPPPGAPIPDPSSGKPLGQGSTIYVHPVSSGNLLYLDYWWYLTDNPAEGLGLGAFCGAGFVIPGVTCHNHQSDWEGMTVVVDRSKEKPFVTAVQYAQHDKVVRYDWQALLRHWRGQSPRAAHELPVNHALLAIAETARRPLAFVAVGTHATYPTPCDPCKQVATSLGEEVHHGDLPWIGNYTTVCGDQDCLEVLPTREAGSKPALWNAFTGPWGERRCALKYYCDSGTAPAAPGTQRRYNHPTHYDGVVGANWKFDATAGG